MNTAQWIPVASSQDIRPSDNITLGFLGEEELALWRSADGVVQAWENRCPHRGTRFTLGRILQGRLSCAYHGWEFDADDGKCAAIPAHPAMPVPPKVCARTFRAAEAQGMVWVHRKGEPLADDIESPPPSGSAAGQFCRSLCVRAQALRTTQALTADGFVEASPAVWRGLLARQTVTVFLNEGHSHMTLLHIWMEAELPDAQVQHIMAALRTLRTSIEAT